MNITKPKELISKGYKLYDYNYDFLEMAKLGRCKKISGVRDWVSEWVWRRNRWRIEDF